MGNQTSNKQNPQYQRMGSDPSSIRPAQPQYTRAKSSQTSKQQQISMDNVIDTLQSMFLLMDREVLRLVLMEQCDGNLDTAVDTLLAMQSSQSKSQPSKQSNSNKPAQPSNEEILYDDNMIPITISDNFLQPPSHFLRKYYNVIEVKYDQECNGNILECVSLNRLAITMEKHKNNTGVIIDVSHLFNDFMHCLSTHNKNAADFEVIYKKLGGFCDINNCNLFQRNHR
eukprot:438280_1